MLFLESEAQRSEAPSRRGLGKSASGCGLGPRCEKITTGAQSPVLYSTGQRHTASHFFSDSVPVCLCGSTGSLPSITFTCRWRVQYGEAVEPRTPAPRSAAAPSQFESLIETGVASTISMKLKDIPALF